MSNSKLVAGVTLVSLMYPNKDGILELRKGRYEKAIANGTSIVLFVGNGQYRTFNEDKINDLTIING